MIPKDPPSEPRSERRTFLALRDGLDDNWTVLHSVGWQSERYGRQGDGEADFFLIHPRGVLVIEVKGGVVSIIDGRWQSVSSGGVAHSIRDPFLQALDSRKALGRYLQERDPTLGPIHSGHAVGLPDIRAQGDFGPEAPREIIIDREDMDDISSAILRIADHWSLRSDLDPHRIARIRQLLAPTLQVRPLLADQLENIEKELLRLTNEQIATLQGMRRNRRMLVFGAAGTGKTVLAAERARQLAKDGFHVLLLCFNQPLGYKLRTELTNEPSITATHVHSFARRTVDSAGRPVPNSPWSDWWDTDLPELLQDCAGELELGFSALVIDEGQDFHPNWWVPLQLLMDDPDGAPFYVFADKAQQLYQPNWTPPFAEPSYELSVNCRNTLPIAGRVSSMVGLDMPSLGTEGPAPRFVNVKNEQELPAATRTLVEQLKEEGFRSSQIAVLTPSKELWSRLKDLQFRPSSDEDPLDDDVLVETVHRFKGLESDIVILALAGPRHADRALAYVGMSRARVLLIVAGTKETRQAIGWD